MQVVKARVRMSELHSQELTVGEWEVPVLRAVHGDTSVQVRGEPFEIEGEVPEPVTEFNRMIRRYGGDVEQGGVPYVAQVYGQHEPGIRQLAQAIAVSQPKPKKGKAEPAKEAENPLADVG